MSGMRTLGIVAMREILERGRSKAYLVTTAVTALIILGTIVVPSLIGGGTDEVTIGVVGSGNEEIIDTATRLANANDEAGDPPSLAVETVQLTDQDEADTALVSGEVDLVLIDGTQLLVENASGLSGSEMVSRIQRAAATVQIEQIVAEEGDTAADVITLLTSDPLEAITVTGDGPQDEGQTLIAYAGMMLLYLAILLYGTWILTGVTEEKTNRVVEVLLSSVRPWQILGGKILGIGVLALAQLLGTVAVALAATRLTGSVELPEIGLSSVVNLLVWFVLGFAIFAVLFGSAGSLVSRTEDAQTIAFPMSMAAVAGFFASIAALNEPDGVVAVTATFIPLTAPFVVPVRAALESIPIWQYIAAVVIALASIALLTRLAGRIYRGALLKTNKVGVLEAWRSATD